METEYWPNRSFTLSLFSPVLSNNKQLAIILFQDFVPEMYILIKWDYFSLFYFKIQTRCQVAFLPNKYFSFIKKKKKAVNLRSIFYAFLWPSLHFFWLLAYRCSPFLVCVFTLLTSFQALCFWVLLNQLGCLLNCLWFFNYIFCKSVIFFSKKFFFPVRFRWCHIIWKN